MNSQSNVNASSHSDGLVVKDLRVDYGAFTAVDGISFHIPSGEVFGLVGPNGAGKTSTIKVLATLMIPTYGDVSLHGVDILEDPDAIHSMMGYMPDLAPVIGDLKVWEFVDLFAAAYGWDPKTRKDRVEQCLRQVEMWESKDTYGKNLSRGMTQRVVLAKTLLPNPKLLLLDEPASGMDPIARIQLRDILLDLGKKGVIVVISSHILTELSDMCSSVGIMHKGHMRYVGPIDEISDKNTGAPTRIVEVELLHGESEAMETFIANSDEIKEWVKQSETVYDLVIEGDQAAQVQFLKTLLREDLKVLTFTQKSTLEKALKSIATES